MKPINTHLYKTVTIKEIKEEIEGFKTFIFDNVPAIPYQAGQYLTLVDYVNNEEVRRSYSITSSPALQEPLTIGVKRIENGLFSRKLIDTAKPGDTWLTTGTGGFFILPQNTSAIRQLFFFAAGSGITPIYSLLKTVLYQYPHIQVILIYSNASPEKAIFREALESFLLQYPQQLRIAFLYSNALNLNRARLHRDLLLQLLKEYTKANANEILYYICGPESYMRMCTYILQEKNIPKERIKRENFVIQKTIPVKAEPPDKSPHQVTILSGGQQIRFTTTYPQTILSAAEASGFALPYSCRVGQCGNCVAKCTAGKVWMSYNEVLTEEDIGKGLILTCTAHPLYSEVILEI